MSRSTLPALFIALMVAGIFENVLRLIQSNQQFELIISAFEKDLLHL
jgi:hypothetical protein